MQNLYVPKGVNDDSYKRAKLAGYDDAQAMNMAVAEGIVKGISKDNKNIDSYKLGDVIEKHVNDGQTAILDATVLYSGKSMNKVMGSMNPDQRKLVADRVDTQSTEYLARMAPDMLAGKSVGKNKIFLEREELQTRPTNADGEPLINRRTGEVITKPMKDPERNTKLGTLYRTYDSLSEADKIQAKATADAAFAARRNAPPPGQP